VLLLIVVTHCDVVRDWHAQPVETAITDAMWEVRGTPSRKPATDTAGRDTGQAALLKPRSRFEKAITCGIDARREGHAEIVNNNSNRRSQIAATFL
jgi:hypothetical protein